MLRIVGSLTRAVGTARAVLTSAGNLNLQKLVSANNPCLASFATNYHQKYDLQRPSTLLSQPIVKPILPAVLQPLRPRSRSLTKFSLQKGKRKSVKAVVKRFYRLHWGGWIRTRSGRHKKLWKKSPALRRRLRQHVFVNATQAWLLDKMVTAYWRRPKYYVDDPYNPYHTREEFWITRKKPIVPQ